MEENIENKNVLNLVLAKITRPTKRTERTTQRFNAEVNPEILKWMTKNRINRSLFIEEAARSIGWKPKNKESQ